MAFRFRMMAVEALWKQPERENGCGSKATLTPAVAKPFPNQHTRNVPAIWQLATADPSVIALLACETAGEALPYTNARIRRVAASPAALPISAQSSLAKTAERSNVLWQRRKPLNGGAYSQLDIK